MFTGLIQAVGVVREIHHSALASRLVIDPADLLHASAPAPPFAPGESISVSGVCLTLALPVGADGLLHFDVVPETLRWTDLGSLQVDDRVNLERSVTPASLLGGHIVQGHVDVLGVVLDVERGTEWRVRVSPLPVSHARPMQYLVPKGSVAIDGVSLTVASLGADAHDEGAAPSSLPPPPTWFEVALIPTTLAKTTLSALKPGDHVNLEFDALAKTIVHWLQHFSPAAPAGPAR